MTDITQLVTDWRCDRTGNPVGTDTRAIGAGPCPCQGCRAALRIAALAADNERLKASMDAICSEAVAARVTAMGMTDNYMLAHLEVIEARASTKANADGGEA